MRAYATLKELSHSPAKRPAGTQPNQSSMAVAVSLADSGVLSRQHAPPCPCGGGCPRCRGVMQPKLIVSQPQDRYEQEADRVADLVMRMPEPDIRRKPT